MSRYGRGGNYRRPVSDDDDDEELPQARPLGRGPWNARPSNYEQPRRNNPTARSPPRQQQGENRFPSRPGPPAQRSAGPSGGRGRPPATWRPGNDAKSDGEDSSSSSSSDDEGEFRDVFIDIADNDIANAEGGIVTGQRARRDLKVKIHENRIGRR